MQIRVSQRVDFQSSNAWSPDKAGNQCNRLLLPWQCAWRANIIKRFARDFKNNDVHLINLKYHNVFSGFAWARLTRRQKQFQWNLTNSVTNGGTECREFLYCKRWTDVVLDVCGGRNVQYGSIFCSYFDYAVLRYVHSYARVRHHAQRADN